jgi:peptidoglycan/LPS O-acetylase OafA/YrhL
MGILRFLLALAVLAAHCGPILGIKLVGGQVAVQSFYIISGFYMTLILQEKYVKENNSYKLFLTNRLLRLYPMYWVVLILTMAFCVFVFVNSGGQRFPKFENYTAVRPDIFSFAGLILTNIFILGQDLVMFLGINPESGTLFFTSNFQNTNPFLHTFLFIPQGWSLGIEITFYIIAPFILRKSTRVIGGLLIIAILLRLFIYNYLQLQNDPWSYRFFPTDIAFFLLGNLSYKIYVVIHNKPISKTVHYLVLIFVCAFTLIYQFISPLKLSYIPFSFKALSYFLVVMIAIPLLFKFLKQNKADALIGELSYPMYISHILILMITQNFPQSFPHSGLSISLVVIIFSYLLNVLIAKPFEKYRQSRLK